MRRWFALFLLIFLPLQSVWAAAGVYCQHERKEAARHFGHHEHKHVASFSETDSETSGQQNLDSNDCCFHLGHCVGFLDRQSLPMLPAADVFGEAGFPSYASHIPDGPERPNIALAA
jgi:hypothetical protein